MHPTRAMQHCIDFVPFTIIPNNLAYHMSPKEHEELRWQVKEYMEKGLVQESANPSAMLALLVPQKDDLWHMCIDSHVVNKITIKYRVLIPLEVAYLY